MSNEKTKPRLHAWSFLGEKGGRINYVCSNCGIHGVSGLDMKIVSRFSGTITACPAELRTPKTVVGRSSTEGSIQSLPRHKWEEIGKGELSKGETTLFHRCSKCGMPGTSGRGDDVQPQYTGFSLHCLGVPQVRIKKHEWVRTGVVTSITFFKCRECQSTGLRLDTDLYIFENKNTLPEFQGGCLVRTRFDVSNLTAATTITPDVPGYHEELVANLIYQQDILEARLLAFKSHRDQATATAAEYHYVVVFTQGDIERVEAQLKLIGA